MLIMQAIYCATFNVCRLDAVRHDTHDLDVVVYLHYDYDVQCYNDLAVVNARTTFKMHLVPTLLKQITVTILLTHMFFKSNGLALVEHT